jgi:hypothetical protein
MNKIPKCFLKLEDQTEEDITTPTKDILTPAELDKLKKKVKAELASVEARIAYIAGRRHRPKEGDSNEIQQLEAEISNLETKYKEIVDPKWVLYKQKNNQHLRLLRTIILPSLTQKR